MFTAIPMPRSEWDERGGSSALSLIGAAGALIGAITAAVYFVLSHFGVNPLLTTLFASFSPHILSGFLHLDGYMDVSDAVLSHRDREGRLKILKDSHCGSFAVIMIVMLASALLFCTHGAVLMNISPWFFFAVPIISRSAAGLALLTLKPLEGSSLGKYFTQNKKPVHSVILAATLLIGIIIAIAVSSPYMIVLPIISYAIALASVYRSLGGINGDVTGFLICVTEAALIAGVIL